MQHYNEALCCTDLSVEEQFVTLWVAAPFLQSFECLCHSLGVWWCPTISLGSVVCKWRRAEAQWLLLPPGSTEGERKDLWVWKQKRASVRNLHILGVTLGFCLFVCFPLETLMSFSAEVLQSLQFHPQHSNSPVGRRLFPSHGKLFRVRIQICLFKSDNFWCIYSVNMSLNRSNRG